MAHRGFQPVLVSTGNRFHNPTSNSAQFEETLINPTKPVCGAKTRQGESCREMPSEGKKRCRLHGGAKGSGAPTGERNGRFRHGRYSAETRAKRIAEAAERRTAADEWLAKIPTWESRALIG
jgi:hypothetical protein